MQSHRLSRGSPRAGALLACALVLAALLVAGCGYQFIRHQKAGADSPRVFLRTLENATAEPRVELIFTEALRREVLRRGALRIVTDEAAADFRIWGSVVNVEADSRSFSSTVLALEYTLVLALDLQIQQRDGSPVRLGPQSLVTSDVYLASADVEAGRKNRRETLRRVSDVLAVRVVDTLDQVAFP